MSKILFPRRRKTWQYAFPAFAFFLVVSCACSAIPTGSGDAGLGTTRSPKPGHWSNEDVANGEATVSFDLSEDGSISNFKMTASFGIPRQSCTMTLDQTRLEVQNNGDFKISYSIEYSDVEAQLGPAVMEVFGSAIPKDKPYEVMLITGKASQTEMNGTFTINICRHTLFLKNNTGPWKAEWKNP
jgi:hypothetical protein